VKRVKECLLKQEEKKFPSPWLRDSVSHVCHINLCDL